ncbi:MAG: type II secretion system protein GspF [Deltaproteobacteria bacterium HGW-Deltaproteobacteria-15]|jgi:general secretion pathway protein F|nr:MAG: type II secretion system protein GspF [Deltaproteobacteria bacterium HGW-Deltaproteobacteria-15]
MPVYEYKALNRKGKGLHGLITADGPAAARLKLSQEMIFPTMVREVEGGEGRSGLKATLSFLPSLRSIKSVEVTMALRQLATLLSSGLQLVESLNGVIEQTEQGRLKRVLIQIKEKVVEGMSLSDAMEKHPSAFNTIFVNMVRAGETGGALDVILLRLADFSEKRMKLKKKIEAALAYPLFLLLLSSMILIFLLSFVMPKVVGIFQGMKLALPWSTLLLIHTTNFMKSYWWLVATGSVAIAVLFSLWTRTGSGRLVWDRLRLSAPLVGRLHHKAVIARFTRTLSTLLKSGVILVEALEIARLSMGNRIMDNAVKEAGKLVSEGEEFGILLKRSKRFPPLVVQLVTAGEKGGELDSMLAKAAEVYEEDVETTITSLTSLLEPVVILFMGGMVGFIVMAVLLPIFDMTTSIK